MTDTDRFRLLFGPYLPPAYRLGDKLTCEYRDTDVAVTRVSPGRIPWPAGHAVGSRPGRAGLIVTGGLVEAVRQESEIAVAHWWGVSITTVFKWRRSLGVGRITAGTGRLYMDYFPEKRPDLSSDPAAAGSVGGAVRGDQLRGRTAHPAVREALLEASRRPKSEDWKRKARERAVATGARPRNPNRPDWTPEEDAALGTAPDREVATKLGRPLHGVRGRRLSLGIPAFRSTGGIA